MAISPLERALANAGWTQLLPDNVDVFLQMPGPAIMFFAGDPQKRPETNDLAVILPELQCSFGDEFRVGVVLAGDHEAELKSRFGVHYTPTLSLFSGGELQGHIPKLRDWSVYQRKLTEFLHGAISTPAS